MNEVRISIEDAEALVANAERCYMASCPTIHVIDYGPYALLDRVREAIQTTTREAENGPEER